ALVRPRPVPRARRAAGLLRPAAARSRALRRRRPAGRLPHAVVRSHPRLGTGVPPVRRLRALRGASRRVGAGARAAARARADLVWPAEPAGVAQAVLHALAPL